MHLKLFCAKRFKLLKSEELSYFLLFHINASQIFGGFGLLDHPCFVFHISVLIDQKTNQLIRKKTKKKKQTEKSVMKRQLYFD